MQEQYKCLALPGWSNDAEIMKQLMKQLDKTLKPLIKFEYLNPSYDVSKSISQLPSHVQAPKGGLYYRWGDIHLDHGDDVKFLRDKIINDPTIIGVAGFSQGTYLVGELGQLAHSDQELRKRLKFLMAFSSNGIKAEKKIYSQKRLITIPTLQTFGTRDPLYMESLFQSTEYLEPLTLFTNATHRVPIFDYNDLNQIVKFVEKAIHLPKL